jgi:hypothetical protein
MQMIDVLKRLAALDANNPNVVNPASPKKKQQVKEDTSVAECGPMGMMGSMGMDRPSTPASFSINASAADGQEVSQMLRDIMNLAGMGHEKPDSDMGIDKEPVTGGNMPAPSENELMRSMLDTMNDPEDGDVISAAPPAPVDDMGGMDAGMGGMDDMGSAEAVPDDVGSMADHVRGMADELADTDKEELGLESWDNTPADPTNVPEFDSNKFAYNPNAGGVNKGVTNQPTATLEDQLYNEYKKFVSEEKAKTMSRAAKGYEKYGKKGMKALADAGKAGKDLEPVRAKYNKYD